MVKKHFYFYKKLASWFMTRHKRVLENLRISVLYIFSHIFFLIFDIQIWPNKVKITAGLDPISFLKTKYSCHKIKIFAISHELISFLPKNVARSVKKSYYYGKKIHHNFFVGTLIEQFLPLLNFSRGSTYDFSYYIN